MPLSDSLTNTSRSTFTRSSRTGNPESRELAVCLEARVRSELSQVSSRIVGVTVERRTIIKQNEMPTTGLVCNKMLGLKVGSFFWEAHHIEESITQRTICEEGKEVH